MQDSVHLHTSVLIPGHTYRAVMSCCVARILDVIAHVGSQTLPREWDKRVLGTCGSVTKERVAGVNLAGGIASTTNEEVGKLEFCAFVWRGSNVSSPDQTTLSAACSV